MKYYEFSVSETGTAKREKIFPALQVHVLAEGDNAFSPRLCTVDRNLFKRRIGSRDLSASYVLERVCDDRFLDVFLEPYLDLDFEICSLFDQICAASVFVQYGKSKYSGLFLAVFQRIGVPAEPFFPVSGRRINSGNAATRLGMFGWPPLGEELEIWRDIELCRSTGCALHICHISTAKGLEMVKAAKAEGLPVTCEVTPHHLFLCDEDIDDTYNTNLKMNPPLRKRSDMEALVEGILDGSIDCLVTDHAPHAAHEKDCEWEIAFFGTIGLETSLPLMLTNLVSTGKMSWNRLVEVMAINPRNLLRCKPVKIEAGSQADLTLIDPKREIDVTKEYFVGKSKNSAFLGSHLTGVATDVLMAGKRTLADGVVA